MRGDGGIYRPKDRRSWYCYMPAKPKRAVRGPFRTEAEARRAWKDLRREMAAGTYRGPEAERVTVKDLLDGYKLDLVMRGAKSMVSFEAHRKAVEDAIGHVRAVEVTADMVNRIRRTWLDVGTPRKKAKKAKLRKKKEATTDRYLETLGAAYKLAVKQERLGADRVPYIELIRPNNRRTGFVDEDVFWKLHAALLEAERPAEADAALFAYRSGWRRGEVEGLTWDQVDAPARECRLWDSKNGRGRVLPLEDELWEVIQRRLASRAFEAASGPALSVYVFHRQGEPLGDWRKTWRAACKGSRRADSPLPRLPALGGSEPDARRGAFGGGNGDHGPPDAERFRPLRHRHDGRGTRGDPGNGAVSSGREGEISYGTATV